MKTSECGEILQAIRQGHQEEAEKLVRHYEPIIRRAIRLRLDDPRLRRVFDSMDICQSILAKFFQDAAKGKFTAKSEQDLEHLLVHMAIQKVIDKQRHERRNSGSLPEEWEPAAAGPSPSQVVTQGELLTTVTSLLSEKERWLAEQRAEGRSWVEMAAETGETRDGLRMMHARAMVRVRRALGGTP